MANGISTSDRVSSPSTTSSLSPANPTIKSPLPTNTPNTPPTTTTTATNGTTSRLPPTSLPRPHQPRRKSSSQLLHVGSLNTASFSMGMNLTSSAPKGGDGFPSSSGLVQGNGLGLGLGRGVGDGVGARLKRTALLVGERSANGSGSASGSPSTGGITSGGITVGKQGTNGSVATSVQRNGFGMENESVVSTSSTSLEPLAPLTKPAPKLFDFRMTDRPGGISSGNIVNGNGTTTTTTTTTTATTTTNGKPTGDATSLLSQRIRVDPHPTNLRTTSTSALVTATSSTSALSSTGTRISRVGSMQGNLNPKPVMRPRAMSVTMRIKGEVKEDGEILDPDEEFGDDDGDEDIEMQDEEGKSSKIVRDVGKGSGGIKGKRKGMVFRCESCSKVYRHPSCLSKHRWEHSPHWAPSSKFALSKHQQVQLLEAATILMHMDASAIGGKTLPDDKNLWPEAVSPPNRLARKLPPRSSFSSTLRPNFSPLTPPTSLPGQEETPVVHRKTSPDQSTDEYTDDSSPRSISVDPDSGGDSGVGGTNIVSNNMAARRTSLSSSSNGRPAVPRRTSSASQSPSFGGLADLAGFHISSNSPRMYGGAVVNGGYSNMPLVNGYNNSPSKHGRSLLSPSYASLNLPQSSLRSGIGLRMGDALEEEDEEEEEMERQRIADDMEVEDSPPAESVEQDEVIEDFGAEDMEM